MGMIVRAVAVGLILSKLWWGCDTTDSDINMSPSTSEEDDQLKALELERKDHAFTRGQIHYLTMDAGMSHCWNNTVKKLTYLACPKMFNNPELEVELAYLLTSCFCMSIGAPRLTCRKQRDIDDYYHFSLIECATGKCLNKYDADGFEINYSRIRDVCEYLFADTQPYDQESSPSIPYIEDQELDMLNKVVSGEHFGQYDTRLNILLDIVTAEIQTRREGIMFWITKKIEEFWLIVDDIKFKLRVGKYAGVPYY